LEWGITFFNSASLSELVQILLGGGGTPYMGYTGMCSPKGYGFSAVLVINWVSKALVINRVRVLGSRPHTPTQFPPPPPEI